MLPLRYALLLGLVFTAVAVWFQLHQVGYNKARFYQRMGVSCEKYGLYGHAASLRVAAAREVLRAAPGATATATRVTGDFAADQYLHAARLLSGHGSAGWSGNAHGGPELLPPELAALAAEAHRAAPWREDARAALLLVQHRLGDSLALRHLTDLAYREEDVDAQMALASLLAGREQWDDAVALLEHAARRAPDDVKIRQLLAGILLRAGRKHEALEHALEVRRLAPFTGERLRAARLIRAAGGEVPDQRALRWTHLREEYLPTALVVGAYLLLLCVPGLLRRVRAA